jgi:starch synthase (maltosyl-transferring)
MPFVADAAIPADRTRSAGPAVSAPQRPDLAREETDLRSNETVRRSPYEGDDEVTVREGISLSAPKIYYLHYPLIGRLSDWSPHLARCRALGFDYLAIPPPFAPGALGDPFLTADFDVPHPELGLGRNDVVIDAILQLCAEHGLKLIVDVVLDRVASDGIFAISNYSWFRFATPTGDELPDPRRAPQAHDVALARLDDADVAAPLARWWIDRLVWLAQRGVSGFRCLGLDRVPVGMWRDIVSEVRDAAPQCLFLGWTPPLDRGTLRDFVGIGFDYVFAAANGNAPTSNFFDEIEALRRLAPIIAVPELPFGARLAPSGGAVQAAYRRAIDFATATADGVLVPIGFEFAACRPLDPIYSESSDLAAAEAEAPFRLDQDIAAANARLDRISRLELGGRLTPLPAANGVGAMLRKNGIQAGQALLLLTNGDLGKARALEISPAALAAAAGAFGSATRLDCEDAVDTPLAPGEVRILRVRRGTPVIVNRRNRSSIQRAVKAPRIAIEDVAPCVDGGRFAAKRIVGDDVVVEADIFTDGHDALAAELLWRPSDESEWRRAPMISLDNDRWRGHFVPTRIGGHLYTIEARHDRWTSLTRDIEKKQEAGQDVALDLADAIQLVETAKRRASAETLHELTDLLAKLSAATGDERIAVLLATTTRAAMRAADDRPFLTRGAELTVDVDRPQAGFASWYEMFPRSATNDPQRHGTFDDVVARLPAIEAMGFDVLYFPPIHPIGTTNRKGRNNALRATADDPGSPYAIGDAEGGHDAIHPALGTLDDFRRLREAAADHGLEIALDFAVQCSPDHPWLKDHADWFSRRADGSIRYAENPPKKYEDIVNPDFYAPAAMPDLWTALRDIVLFWIGEGIRIFRVDNPHTKPLPFWEWLIADIRSREPDAIFLAEAFTRPKPMYRLAKLGFTQSYTYFTWRNTKRELIDYLTELTQGPARDFFRPNFFVNTPDINPFFLQRSGRGGFLIRAALAATLSGLWGMYSGFEQCEAAPLPGREEYLDSEKYQIRARDPASPGNIVAEIAALNRIRRFHATLHSHLGVTFYNAFNNQVLVYGKVAPHARKPLREMILVTVSLDPHQVEEADFELPLWEFGLPDHGSLAVEDLMRGHSFTLSGKIQHMRLDPNDLPFAIWRLSVGDR